MSRPRNVRVPGDDTGGVQEPSFPILHDSLRRAQKEATVVRTPRGLEPAYTPRRSGRFDQIGVLTTLSSAPLLPSPALTPRQGPTDVSTNFGPQRGDVSVFTPRHSILGGINQSPPDNYGGALDRSSWLPSPRQSFRFQGSGADSVLDGSVMAKHQVLETQEPEFISKLENSLIQKRDGDTSVRHSFLPGFLGLDLSAKVLEERESELGDLEAEIERVQKEAASRPALPAAQDMEVEEVWQALMMWCGTHEDSLNQSQIEVLGHGLDVWRIEGFRPVLQPRNTAFCTGDVYLILNRVDDREGAIGGVNEAYHMRRTRVRTLWTCHFWIGREAHALKAGVAAVLATDLCKVLKRHARPIREFEGEESDVLLTIFPRGINAVPGSCPLGFHHVEHKVRTPRLIRVQMPAGKPSARPTSTLVALDPRALHADACFILDTEHAIYHYVGANAPIKVFAAAYQIAAALHFRERTGRVPAPLVTVNHSNDSEAEEGFWRYLGATGAEMVQARESVRARCDPLEHDADVDLVLYRIDDLQDELEVSEVQKGGPLNRGALLERGACLVLDLHSAIYVWKGRGATLDARNVGLQLARDLSSSREQPSDAVARCAQRTCPVVILASDSDDVLFMSQFLDTQWVVYADLAVRGAALSSEPVKIRETSVRKMHSVTVRSWLETGQAVRQYNKTALLVHQGMLSGLKAWSIDNFSLTAVTEDMMGHFVMDRSYLIQCTYRTEGLDRHVIYFWQGWNCSRVESLVWQYDISALMATQIEKQTGSKPLQVRVQQGKEPGHLLALFDGAMVVHARLSTVAPSASSRTAAVGGSDGRRKSSDDLLKEKEAKGRGRLYTIAGTAPSRAYSVQVEASASSLNSNSCFMLYAPTGAVFLWLGHWADMQQRNIASYAAQRHQQASGGAFRITTIHERQEPLEFWEALGAAAHGADHVCAGYLREIAWWRPRLFGCKAVAQSLRVREVFDFVQADLRHHKAMLLDNYNQVFLWVGPQCNAVVQRMALALAGDYIQQAPDGRNKQLQVTVVGYKREPEAFRAHFPYWLAWAPMVGEEADEAAARKSAASQQAVSRAHGVAPSVLRQALLMLNKVPTRHRNALDLIVWKNHERAKWLRWGTMSPFQNTFFQKAKGAREEKPAQRGGGEKTHLRLVGHRAPR